ncbi:MAG: ABC transporter ATP-binding protein [Lachnospiraceae bacterium]|nr:ABC transporter ATP-binding protein [Lachnospiraceae bacterium]
MKRYIKYAKKYWYHFLLGPLFMMLEACGEFILPYINKNIIDIGAANGDVPYIFQNGIYMGLLAFFMLATGVLGANFSIRGATRLAAGVRDEVFVKIQEFSFSDIDDFTTGSLITRITNDVTQIQNFAQTALRGMFRSPIMLIGALIMSFHLNSNLAWAILIIVPILGISIAAIILVASPRYTKMQQALDTVNNGINESITNIRVIKSFVREDYEIGKFGKINQILVDKSTSALKVMLLMQPVSALAVNVSTLAVVWISGRQIMVGDMELGTLTAFITYLSQILTALTFVANIVLQGTRAAASHKRISQVLDTKVKLTDSDAAYPDKKVENGSIEFKNVSFKYFKNNKDYILENIDFKINAGELIGIIGSTGSGKSTLVSLIPRLYDPDEGEIYIDGTNIKDLSFENLRDSISYVLQKNTLFSGTIAENLRWGNEFATMEEIRHAATVSQADGFVMSFPEGYETDLSQGGLNLSGGQKQRLCIARALLKKPQILILDDSTSAVDTATDASIRKAFREELPGITKLIIAQRISSVEDADRIMVLDEGKIVGFDSHSVLLKTCTAYQEIYYSQKDKEEA